MDSEKKKKKDNSQTHILSVFNENKKIIVKRYFPSYDEVFITDEKIHSIGTLIFEELAKQETKLYTGIRKEKKEQYIESSQELELIIEVEKVICQNADILLINKETELIGSSYRLCLGKYPNKIRHFINLKAVLPAIINEIRIN